MLSLSFGDSLSPRPETSPETEETLPTYKTWTTEELRDLSGISTPRIQTPRGNGPSQGSRVEALAEIAGMAPWEWQRLTLDLALCTDPATGRWLRRSIVLLVARQNGKTRVLLLRILAGLFLFPEKLIVHTAADRALPRHIFGELVDAIQDVPMLREEIDTVRLTNGNEELTLKDGSAYRIMAPRQQAMRGWTVDTFIVDEAREQRDDAMLSAGIYMQRAVPNPQMWLVSNAGDPDSVILRRYRDRGLAAVDDPGSDPAIALIEYSADPERSVEDPEGWREANPALGISIGADAIIEELRSDDPQKFRTEALCQWVETATETAVPLDKWILCGDPELKLTAPALGDRVMMAVDIDPARLEAAIVIAVTKPPAPDAPIDEDTGEPIGPPTLIGVAQRWVSEWGVDETAIARALQGWADHWSPEAIGFDPYTCSGLIERLPPDTYPTEPVTGVKWVNACSSLWDAAANESIVHASDPYLDAQIASAGRRDVGDGTFRIARLNSAIAIPGVMALARALYLSLRPRRRFEIL